MKKILVVDDDDTMRRLLERVLRDADFEVLTAADGRQGWEVFEEEKPFLVFSDVEMPKMDGLELLKKIKKSSPQTIVVVMTSYSSEDRVIAVLKLGGDNYLKKPFEISEINSLANRYREFSEEKDLFRQAAGRVDHLHLNLTLENNLGIASSASKFLVRQIEPFLFDEDLTSIRLGLFEMLLNAIEHGNLQIDYESKSEALHKNEFLKLFEQRRKDPNFINRRVFVDMEVDQGACRVDIRDQGSGFDWRRWISRRNSDSVLAAHGRGIMMTQLYFDKIFYNEAGNHVTLIKNLVESKGVDSFLPE